jgi:hypothetical protein
MFEYLRDVVKSRLNYSGASFGAKVLLDWGEEGAVLIDGTTPVPSNITAKSDTPADLAIRAAASDFERALMARQQWWAGPARGPVGLRPDRLREHGDMGGIRPARSGISAARGSRARLSRHLSRAHAAQRLHLESHGYVVVEDAIPRSLVGRLVDAIREMQARADAGEFPEGLGATLYSNRPDYFRVLQPHLADDAALDYVIDPRILGMAREATGGARIRYIEADCQIRRPNALEADTPMISADGLHRGIRANWSLELHGRSRSPFVKMLTNLTDLGPDDGGTVVVPGSHRSKLTVGRSCVLSAAIRQWCGGSRRRREAPCCSSRPSFTGPAS